MYFFGRGVSAFFNQFFKWLFWNKTGQKLLFCILIVVIFFVFVKCGEVAAVEEVEDVNYKAYSSYDAVVNDAILRIYYNIQNNGNNINSLINYIKGDNIPYFFYNANNGSSYNNAYPLNTRYLNTIFIGRGNISQFTATSYDYRAITGKTMYYRQASYTNYVFDNYSLSYNFPTELYVPAFIFDYTPSNWTTFKNSLINNDTEAILQLLEDIKAEQQATNEALTSTTPTSETDSFVEIDSSSVDDLSSSSVDNVFSTMTTGFANKFTNYDLNTVNSFVWNFKGTTITFYSDTIYKMIKNTFFETLLSMLWYYIFGHYAFVWLSNIIHKIKDGSILDGLEVNEVITKEML